MYFPSVVVTGCQYQCSCKDMSQNWPVMDSRPHLFHNLPLPFQFLHRYQLLLLGDRGRKLWTTCLRLLRSIARVGAEPATFWLLVQCSTRSASTSPVMLPVISQFCIIVRSEKVAAVWFHTWRITLRWRCYLKNVTDLCDWWLCVSDVKKQTQMTMLSKERDRLVWLMTVCFRREETDSDGDVI